MSRGESRGCLGLWSLMGPYKKNFCFLCFNLKQIEFLFYLLNSF